MEEIRAKMSEIEEQRHQSYVKYPLADISIIVRMRFETEGEVVAVDGKSIRSTAKAGNPHSALQILSAYVINS